MRRIWWLILVVALLMPAAVAASADVDTAEVAEVKDMEIARQTDALKIAVHYPVLGVDGVDVDVARWAENLVREFERSTAEDNKGGRDPAAPPYELEVSYEVERPSAGVASVIFEVATYTGGAHGTLDILVRTYDLASRMPLTFSHIFEDPEAALNLMSTYAVEALRVELGGNVVEDMLKAGTTPDADNFSTLSLRPNGVRIYFAPYQVAPWSQGALSVDMPLEALTDARPHLELWGKAEGAGKADPLSIPSVPDKPDASAKKDVPEKQDAPEKKEDPDTTVKPIPTGTTTGTTDKTKTAE